MMTQHQLQCKKLNAEIADLEARTRAHAGIRGWVRHISPAVAIAIPILVVYYESETTIKGYVQQAKMAERANQLERELRTNEHLLNLIEKMEKVDDPLLKRNLILHLGNFGRRGIHWLLNLLYTEPQGRELQAISDSFVVALRDGEVQRYAIAEFAHASRNIIGNLPSTSEAEQRSIEVAKAHLKIVNDIRERVSLKNDSATHLRKLQKELTTHANIGN